MDTVVEPVLAEIIVTSYDGDLSESGKYDGIGYATMDNDCVYEGNFQNGLFHGTGRFTWPNEVYYEGEFEYGQMMGNGMYEWADGSTYEGTIKNGKRHGVGIFKCSGGQVYEGEWQDGLRHGKGVLSYNADKTILYGGFWELGLRSGYGQMKYASGNVYEGEWKLDKKCGRGAMSWKSSDEVYVGDWKDDKPEGFGEHIWADTGSRSLTKQMCNMYRGQWKAGVRHGQGSFFYSNGSQYSGTWANNCKEGEGVFIYPDGRIFFGEFSKDRIVAPLDRTKASPDINPQMKLNIEDIFVSYSAVLPEQPALSPTATISIAQILKGTTNVINTSTIGTTAVVANKHVSASLPTPPAKPVIIGNSDALAKTLQRTTLTNGAVAAATQSSTRATLRCISAVAATRAAAESQTQELERLLLRYNTQIRAFYKRNCEVANRKRAHSMMLSIQDKFSAGWCRVEQVLFTVRDLYSQFYCMTLDQFRKMLRDLDICGPFFSSYDLLTCFRQMQRQHQEIARTLQVAHRRETAANAVVDEFSTDENMCKVAKLLDHSFLGDLVGSFGERKGSVNLPDSTHALDNDSRQPILERQFGELLVRCIAMYAAKRGVDSDGVYYAVFRILSEKFEPYSTEKKSNLSPFMHAFYSESVQDCIKSFSLPGAALHTLWKKLTSLAAKSGIRETVADPVIELRQFITLLTKLRGSALQNEATIPALISATGLAVPSTDDVPSDVPIIDTSSMAQLMDFEDFVLALSRVMVSNLWTFHETPQLIASQRASPTILDSSKGSPNRGGLTSRSQAASAPDDDFAKQSSFQREMLSTRLIGWLNSFDQDPFPL